MIGIALVLTHGTFCDGGDHGFNQKNATVLNNKLHWGDTYWNKEWEEIKLLNQKQ